MVFEFYTKMVSRIMIAWKGLSMVIKKHTFFSTNDDEKFTNVIEHPIAK